MAQASEPGGIHLPGTPDREEHDDFPYPAGNLPDSD